MRKVIAVTVSAAAAFLVMTGVTFAQAAAGPAPAASQTQAAPQVNISMFDVVAVVLYILILGWLAWLAFRRARTAEEFLVAGRDTHPVIMALSYGSTFISTSAIVGFGGVAGNLGLSLLWLTVLNIFVGIFVAFALLGAPIRRMGHRLGAHTFPELLAKRFDSQFIQVFAGAVIFILMPMYTAAVMLGGVKFLKIQFGIEYNTGILIFGVIVAFYVIAGGLRGVMYTDAFQGFLMFVGMGLLVIYGYAAAGGVIPTHEALAGLADRIPDKVRNMGFTSYTAMPTAFSDGWWLLVTSLVMGVGIGVLAQPQLSVRFMTVKSRKEINRACASGGIFILAMTGSAFVVGAISNVYFVKNYDKVSLLMTAPAGGKPDPELIIPTFIKYSMPSWFGSLFFITLLSAAMSTLSSQFHTMGAAIGRDIYERLFRGGAPKADVMTRVITQAGIAVAVIVSLIISWKYAAIYETPTAMIIAKATSIFFALCAATFLPSLVLGLFWRRMNKAAAVASMLAGLVFSTFWLACVNADTAKALPVLKWVVGVNENGELASASVFTSGYWSKMDALVLALPISFVVAIAVSLVTKPMSDEHLTRCFAKK